MEELFSFCIRTQKDACSSCSRGKSSEISELDNLTVLLGTPIMFTSHRVMGTSLFFQD